MKEQPYDSRTEKQGQEAAMAGLLSDHRLVVFADITCPFTHVGLRHFVAERGERGADRPLVVMSWPLELINGGPQTGPELAPKIAALQRTIAPDLFAGFDPEHFPASSLPALALVAAAYRLDQVAGEQLSMDVRTALFEEGADIADPEVLADLAEHCGLADLVGDDDQVTSDWHRGEALHVVGSPHFIVEGDDFFCPGLAITHEGDELSIAFDQTGFEAFLATAFA